MRYLFLHIDAWIYNNEYILYALSYKYTPRIIYVENI
jgi:hypothetical protein